MACLVRFLHSVVSGYLHRGSRMMACSSMLEPYTCWHVGFIVYNSCPLLSRLEHASRRAHCRHAAKLQQASYTPNILGTRKQRTQECSRNPVGTYLPGPYIPTIFLGFPVPKGPSAQYSETCPKPALQRLLLQSQVPNYWVLGPLGP